MVDLFVYMDEDLVKNMNSMLLEGYIDIHTVTNIRDRTLTGNLRLLNRDNNTSDNKCSRNENDGYKSKSFAEDNNYQNGRENNAGIEDREYTRREEQIKKINAVFSFHNQIVNTLNSLSEYKKVSNIDTLGDNISAGQFIEVDGEVTCTSLCCYLDALINILNCYDIDVLNNLLVDKKIGLLNYTSILKLLQVIKDGICANDTRDLVLLHNDEHIVLNVNKNFFLNSNFNMYDLMHCKCRIIGKVMMVYEEDKKLSFLRKTSQEDYYSKMLDQLEPYLNLLSENGVLIPERPAYSLDENYIVLLPLSICI
ncbi:DUF6414 family protein [Clostridium sp.]|uniref:DUF6414 family protein n=1 Tax=Clostridium sp. TaxID=1506 RepID=UPI003F340E49